MDNYYDLLSPMSYSLTLVIILLIIIVSLFIILFIKLYYQDVKNSVIHNKYLLRFIYLQKLNYLSNRCRYLKDKDHDNEALRSIYYRLSNIIRSYIELTTGINVLKYSKYEIEMMNIPGLNHLMAEYYPPEFASTAKKTYDDALKSITKTKEVIKKW